MAIATDGAIRETGGGPHGYEMFLGILVLAAICSTMTVRWIGGVVDPKGFELNRLKRDRKAPGRSRRA